MKKMRSDWDHQADDGLTIIGSLVDSYMWVMLLGFLPIIGGRTACWGVGF
jgi:hypothetical protein